MSGILGGLQKRKVERFLNQSWSRTTDSKGALPAWMCTCTICTTFAQVAVLVQLAHITQLTQLALFALGTIATAFQWLKVREAANGLHRQQRQY